MTTLSMDVGVDVPMPDGVKLRTDVIRPAGAGRHPVVVMRTAYDRTTAASTALQIDALGMAKAGYAVVLQDVRGRFASGGAFDPFVNEQADGIAVLDWCSDQPWSNGRVAMAGISYNSFCQLAPAAAEPGALGAIVPGLGPQDIRTSWLQVGGVDNLGFHLAWILGPLLANDRRVTDVESVLEAWDRPTGAASAGFDHPALALPPASGWLEAWTSTERPFDGDSRVPDASDLSDLAVPALVVAGWFDVFATGSLDLAADAGDRSALVVGPWDHSGLPLGRRSGDRDHGRHAEVSLPGLQQDWYDLHLRGEGSNPAAARVFITGIDEWVSYRVWPPPSSTATWWLGSGTLGDARSDGTSQFMVDVDDPTPAHGGQLYPWEPDLRPGSFDQQRRRSRPDVVTFSSPPLPDGRRFVGAASAELGAEGPDGAILVVTLVDIHPDGSVWNVGEGVARVEATGPTHIDLGYVGHEFRPGHAIGLDVSGAAWPRFPLIPGSHELDLAQCSLSLPEVSR